MHIKAPLDIFECQNGEKEKDRGNKNFEIV